MPDGREEVGRWLAYAEDDYLYALEGEERFPRGATWNFQQAAEKYLKGLLLARGEMPPRTHDIAALLAKADATLTADDPLVQAALVLSAIAPTRRYPGDMPEVSLSECRQVREAAEVIREFVRVELNLE